jgi:hypothetical protein
MPQREISAPPCVISERLAGTIRAGRLDWCGGWSPGAFCGCGGSQLLEGE